VAARRVCFTGGGGGASKMAAATAHRNDILTVG